MSKPTRSVTTRAGRQIHYKNPGHRVMGMELFEAILKGISAMFPQTLLKTVSFATYNEPTLYPSFFSS